jgi:hypothetical protein
LRNAATFIRWLLNVPAPNAVLVKTEIEMVVEVTSGTKVHGELTTRGKKFYVVFIYLKE